MSRSSFSFLHTAQGLSLVHIGFPQITADSMDVTLPRLRLAFKSGFAFLWCGKIFEEREYPADFRQGLLHVLDLHGVEQHMVSDNDTVGPANEA